MKAVVLHELGDAANLRLEEVADPQPGPGDVIVRLKAAALNHRDVWIRLGQYAKIELPAILGSDGAGDVVAVGPGVDAGLIGQAVVINPSLDWGDDERVQGRQFRILGMPEPGTHAELIKVPAANVLPKPAHLSYNEVAALPLAAMTAYRAVVVRGMVRAGELVLVTGIGGGVASFALQIAKTIGADVHVTSGSEAKLAKARDLGALGGVNHRQEGWGKELLAQTGGRKPDLVIDSAGGTTFSQALDCLNPGGRLVSYGATIGAPQGLNLHRVFWNQLSVLGTTMGSPADFAAMLAFYETHQLHPTLDEVLPLADAAEAHRRMEAAEQFGKIILRID